MKIQTLTTPISKAACDILLIHIFEENLPLTEQVLTFDQALGNHILA